MGPKVSKGKKASKPPSPRDLLKLEVAEELGLMDKVKRSGWAELTAAESGRLGGLMTRRMRHGTPAGNPKT